MTDGQLLEFSRATKRFGALTAVDDLSAQITPGAVTGFLGPNGAGKTTSLRMLLGLARPTSGTATIGGTPYADLRHPLRTVGSVMEEALYRPRRTAVRQLTIAAKANGIPLSRVDEVVSLVGLQNEAETRIGTYSLGMRQRLSIATALLGDPGALVLDEPANGLDPEGIRWMRLLMRRLADEGRTVLVSSHVLSEIEQIADNVLVLTRGRLVYADSISKLSDPTNGSVIVDAEDRDALIAALTQAGLAYDVLRIGLSVHDTDAATVGALAASTGIALRTLQQRGPTLEEVFLDLVHGRRDPIAGEPSDATRAMPTVTAEATTPSGTGAPAEGAASSGTDAGAAGAGVAAAGVAGAVAAGAAVAGAAGLFGGSDDTGELSPRRAARAQAEAARRPEGVPSADETAETAETTATDDAEAAEVAADRTDTGAEAHEDGTGESATGGNDDAHRPGEEGASAADAATPHETGHEDHPSTAGQSTGTDAPAVGDDVPPAPVEDAASLATETGEDEPDAAAPSADDRVADDATTTAETATDAAPADDEGYPPAEGTQDEDGAAASEPDESAPFADGSNKESAEVEPATGDETATADEAAAADAPGGHDGETPGVALRAPIATDEDFGLHTGAAPEDERPADEPQPGTAPTSLFATPAPAVSEQDDDEADVLPFATQAVSLPPADTAPSFDDLVWGPAANDAGDEEPRQADQDAEATPAEDADETVRISTVHDTTAETAGRDHDETPVAEAAPGDETDAETALTREAENGQGLEIVHVFEPDPATAMIEIPSPDLIPGQDDTPAEPSTETTEIAGIEIFASLTEGQTQEIQVILEQPHEDDHGDDEVTQGEDPRAAALSASLAAAARAYYSDDAPAYTPSDASFTRSEPAPTDAASDGAEQGEPEHAGDGAAPEHTTTPAVGGDAADASADTVSGESRSDDGGNDDARAENRGDESHAGEQHGHGASHHDDDRQG